MTVWQGRTLQIVGGFIALAVVMVVIAAAESPRLQEVSGAETGDGTTTMRLVPVTVPTTVRTLPTTAAPTTTVVPLTTLPPAVSGAGAVLVRPAGATARQLGANCNTLVEDGWRAVGCGRVAASGTDLIWLVQAQEGRLRGLVHRQAMGGAWTPVLASDADGSRWKDIRVKVADLSGDGRPDISFGFHLNAPSDVLSVDVVEGPGRVVVHDDLGRGSAKLVGTGLHTWAVSGADPGVFIHETIAFADGAWRRVESESVDAASVPKSDL